MAGGKAAALAAAAAAAGAVAAARRAAHAEDAAFDLESAVEELRPLPPRPAGGGRRTAAFFDVDGTM